MLTPLRQLLGQFRNASGTEPEKGNYFERLAERIWNRAGLLFGSVAPSAPEPA